MHALITGLESPGWNAFAAMASQVAFGRHMHPTLNHSQHSYFPSFPAALIMFSVCETRVDIVV